MIIVTDQVCFLPCYVPVAAVAVAPSISTVTPLITSGMPHPETSLYKDKLHINEQLKMEIFKRQNNT